MPVWYFGYAHFSSLGNTGPAAILPGDPNASTAGGRAGLHNGQFMATLALLVWPHSPTFARARRCWHGTLLQCHLSSWEAELGNVLKQGAPELNIFTGSACVWQRAEKHREEKEEQPLRSQNILFQCFQNSRAELFALKWPVSDKKATQKYKTNI